MTSFYDKYVAQIVDLLRFFLWKLEIDRECYKVEMKRKFVGVVCTVLSERECQFL